MATKKIEVKQEEGNEIGVEILARAILDVAAGMKKLNESRLTREALIVLIKEKSGVPKYQVQLVLNNLDELENTWLKKALPARRGKK